MSKKKRKSNINMHLKVERAQHRNLFLSKLRKLCIDLARVDIFSLIPPNEIEKMYNTRCYSIKICAAPGQNVPSNFVSETKDYYHHILKTFKLKLNPSGYEISIDDYFTLGYTFFLYLERLKDFQYPNAVIVKNKLLPFSDTIRDSENIFNNKLSVINYSFSMLNSNFSKQLFRMNTNFALSKTSCGIESVIEINIYEPETKIFNIDGNHRPAIKIGWPFSNTQIEWIKQIPLQMKFSKGADKPADVYIQSHALMRLSERIDCICTGILHFNLFISLKEAKAIRCPNDKILIEYRIFGEKVGYLSALLVDGIILIRTFLFITNNDTPEGRNLIRNTGLAVPDKKFLAIDKLSSFMTSDISTNQDIRKIFERAGLQRLLYLHKNLQSFCNKHIEYSPALHLADYINSKQEVYNLPPLKTEEVLAI